MAARGDQAKKDFVLKMKEVFPDMFMYNKEYRVPIYDATSGETIQLKVSLVAAKDFVTNGDDVAMPTQSAAAQAVAPKDTNPADLEPTIEELNKMTDFIKQFNL